MAPMRSPPPCTRLGRPCRELELTLRIADLDDDSQTLQDAAATWLLGHTQRITFGRPYRQKAELLVDATVHVPCKYLRVDGGGPRRGTGATALRDLAESNGRARAQCAAHGFRGPLPVDTARTEAEPVRRANGTYALFFRGRRRWLDLRLTRAAQRALPVLAGDNPCDGAPCRTADNTRGAACCRDLTLEVAAPDSDPWLEPLLRSRQSPYLCKVTRTNEETLECEVISTCAYLEGDGISCGLHDRLLPTNQLAKPSICRAWPDIEEDEVAHPGCRLV